MKHGLWKNLVKKLAPSAKFAGPSKAQEISRAERELKVQFPPGLKEFLREADGVVADWGSRVIWSVAQIEQQNRMFRTTEAFRSLYMNFDSLLFCGDHSGGDHFGYAIQADGQIHRRDIFRWDHETDGRSWFAGGLTQYFELRLAVSDGEDEELA